MPRPNDPRTGAVYRRNRDAARSKPGPCCLCGKPINRALKYPDPWSISAEHHQPVANGGDVNGPMGPAHLICNLRRQNAEDPTSVDYDRPATMIPRTSRRKPRTSRDWQG